MDKIIITLSICEKRVKMYNDEMFIMKDLGSDFDNISDDVYYLLAENKVYQNFANNAWFKKI